MRAASATTRAPTGRLNKKSQRQEAWETTQPPATGPIAPVIALAADQVPIAAPRASAEYAALMSARLPGTSSAAPTPWTARAAISSSMPGAAPHAGGGEREQHHAGREDPPASQAIAERAAHQDQGGEHQRVRLDDPLHLPHRRPEAALHDRERDVDHRPVEEGHARAEDRHHQRPAGVGGRG